MRDLILLLALSFQTPRLPGAAACFVPSDQSAGWKKVPLPAEAPALAAPPDIDQFRGGEPALLVADAMDALEYEGPAPWGRTTFGFKVDPFVTRWLRVEMAADIQGAAVDVIGLSRGRAVSLSRGRRESGAVVAVRWSEPFDEIEVVVHQHLRAAPVVRSVELGTLQSETSSGGPPAAYQQPGFLYFRHPGGEKVTLCNREGETLRYRRGYWDLAPQLTFVERER